MSFLSDFEWSSINNRIFYRINQTKSLIFQRIYLPRYFSDPISKICFQKWFLMIGKTIIHLSYHPFWNQSDIWMPNLMSWISSSVLRCIPLYVKPSNRNFQMHSWSHFTTSTLSYDCPNLNKESSKCPH